MQQREKKEQRLAVSHCFHFFLQLYSDIEKHRRVCKTVTYLPSFWRQERILMCVCSFRSGCAELECSALPGWSNHDAHIHNHDALQPES